MGVHIPVRPVRGPGAVYAKQFERAPVATFNSFDVLTDPEDADRWPPLRRGPCCSCSFTASGATPPAEKVARAPAEVANRRSLRRNTKQKRIALCTRNDPQLQAVVKDTMRPGFKLVEAMVDSGAEANVSPARFFSEPIEPSIMSRTGESYRVANGDGF